MTMWLLVPCVCSSCRMICYVAPGSMFVCTHMFALLDVRGVAAGSMCLFWGTHHVFALVVARGVAAGSMSFVYFVLFSSA